MEKEIKGATVYITGGTKGIGEAVARYLAEKEANVIIFGDEVGKSIVQVCRVVSSIESGTEGGAEYHRTSFVHFLEALSQGDDRAEQVNIESEPPIFQRGFPEVGEGSEGACIREGEIYSSKRFFSLF